MLIADYEKLMKPYSTDGCTVELMVEWMQKKSGCSQEIISLAIRNLFTELAEGKTFPTKGCNCGCGMTNVHTAMNHYLLRTAKAYQATASRAYWKVVEQADQQRIIKHMEVENAKYTKANMTPWHRKLRDAFFPDDLNNVPTGQ